MVAEEVRTALLEALYKLDQGTLKVVEPKTIPELEISQFTPNDEPTPGDDGEAEFSRKVEAHADKFEY